MVINNYGQLPTTILSSIRALLYTGTDIQPAPKCPNHQDTVIVCQGRSLALSCTSARHSYGKCGHRSKSGGRAEEQRRALPRRQGIITVNFLAPCYLLGLPHHHPFCMLQLINIRKSFVGDPTSPTTLPLSPDSTSGFPVARCAPLEETHRHVIIIDLPKLCR